MAASSRTACRAVTMSASTRIGIAHLVLALLPALHQRLAQPGAQVALQQVPGGIHLPLSTPVTAGQREQHRAAAVGRRLGLLQRQQVLDPQPGPAPVQLGSHGTRRRAQLARQRPGCPARRPRGPPGSRARARRGGQRRGHGARSSSASRSSSGSGAAVAGPRPGAGCGGAGPAPATSRRSRCAPYDRVRLQHPRLDPSAAASTRTSVSCTRSSAAAWLPTRAPTIRRTIGISPATSWPRPRRATGRWKEPRSRSRGCPRQPSGNPDRRARRRRFHPCWTGKTGSNDWMVVRR